jgi:hypothetical protein
VPSHDAGGDLSMAATDAQVAELRLMIAEPTDTTYDGDSLKSYIEKFPLTDSAGYEPLLDDGSDNDEWTATYDLHSAAAEIWQQKAAAVAGKFDFDTEDGSFKASQMHKHFMQQARHHAARRSARMVRLEAQPKSDDTV